MQLNICSDNLSHNQVDQNLISRCILLHSSTKYTLLDIIFSYH